MPDRKGPEREEPDREGPERERNPYQPRRRYDRAPAPVKVAVSLLYIQMVMTVVVGLAVNLTLARTPGSESGQWPMSGLLFGLAICYGFLAYRLLQGVEWARRVTIGLTGLSMALALLWFSVWFCILIGLGAVLIAALTSAEARRFCSGDREPAAG